MIKLTLLLTTVLFFAMNIGGSNIAPAFGALYGAKVISHRMAVVWFTLFLFLGGITFGRYVVETLGRDIIPTKFMDFNAVLAILLASCAGLLIANILRVPESTSWTTVFAITGAGLALNHLKFGVFLRIIPFWIFLPILSFVLTFFLYRIVYPPRPENLRIYQAILSNERRVKALAMISAVYIAFAVGTNNIANVVGPLAGGGIVSPVLGLVLVSPLLGLGGFVFGKRIMETVGNEIVPLGLVSATLVSVVTASLLIFASIMGIPQSLVQLSALSIMAVGAVKHERQIIKQKASRKIFVAWLITPVIAFSSGFLTTRVLVGG